MNSAAPPKPRSKQHYGTDLTGQCVQDLSQRHPTGAVTLQKNPTYWKGEPKIDTVIWREMTDEDKIPGVVSGTIDVTDPSYSKEAAEQIKEANSNGEISGDTIQTDLVANLGYEIGRASCRERV